MIREVSPSVLMYDMADDGAADTEGKTDGLFACVLNVTLDEALYDSGPIPDDPKPAHRPRFLD